MRKPKTLTARHTLDVPVVHPPRAAKPAPAGWDPREVWRTRIKNGAPRRGSGPK